MRQHGYGGGLARDGERAGKGRQRLLLQSPFQRRIGFDRGRVHGLPVTSHQPQGHTLAENVVKQAFENRRGKELAGPAHRRVPRQLFVYFVAEKKQDIQPPGAVLHQTPVADQVFQPAHQQELEKDDRVERGLAVRR